MPSRWCVNGVQAKGELLMAVDVIVQRDGSRKSVGGQIKLSLVFLTILLLTVGAIACSGSPTAQKEDKSSIDAPAVQKEDKSSADGSFALSRVVLEVPTISCWTCEPRVAASAKSVPGVKAVEFDGQTVTVTYNPEQTTPDAIVEAIAGGGDRVTEVTKL